MSRRKTIVTKRNEYVDVPSDKETHLKAQSKKRKLQMCAESESSDSCEWEPIQSSPKMIKINRKRLSKDSVFYEHGHDFEMEVNDKKHCTNRNALMARRNRIKKKMYVEKLENTIQELQDNFKSMQKQIHEQNEVIAQVTKENRYLRNVITNSSGLKQILQGVRLAGLANPAHSSSAPQTKPVYPDSNLNSKVHVTDNSPPEDTCPSSTTRDSMSNDKWEFQDMKPIIPVHDFSSNPQLYYDTVPTHRRRQQQDDLQI